MSTLIGIGLFENNSINRRTITRGEFTDFSVNEGTISEVAIFSLSSTNAGNASVWAVFADNSQNAQTGVVQSSAIFAGNSCNYGVVENAIFLDNAVNYGTVKSLAYFCHSSRNEGYIGEQETVQGKVYFKDDTTINLGYVYGNAYIPRGHEIGGEIIGQILIDKSSVSEEEFYLYKYVYEKTDEEMDEIDFPINGYQINGYFANSVLSGVDPETSYPQEIFPGIWFSYDSSGKSQVAEGIIKISENEFGYFNNGIRYNKVGVTSLDDAVFFYDLSAAQEPKTYYSDRFLTNLAKFAVDESSVNGFTLYDNKNIYAWMINENSNLLFELISAHEYSFGNYFIDESTPNNGYTIVYDGIGTGAAIVTGAQGAYQFDETGIPDNWKTDVNGVIKWPLKQGYYSVGYFISGEKFVVEDQYPHFAQDDEKFYVYDQPTPYLADGLLFSKENDTLFYHKYVQGKRFELADGVHLIDGDYVTIFNSQFIQTVYNGTVMFASDSLYHRLVNAEDKGLANGLCTEVYLGGSNSYEQARFFDNGVITPEVNITGVYPINEDLNTYYVFDGGVNIGVADGVQGFKSFVGPYDSLSDYWNVSSSFHLYNNGKDLGSISRVTLLYELKRNDNELPSAIYGYYLNEPSRTGVDNTIIYEDYLLETPLQSTAVGLTGGIVISRFGSFPGYWNITTRNKQNNIAPGTLRASYSIYLSGIHCLYTDELVSGKTKIYRQHPISLTSVPVQNLGGIGIINDQHTSFATNADGIIEWGKLYNILLDKQQFWYFNELISGKTRLYENNPPTKQATKRSGRYDFKYHSFDVVSDLYNIDLTGILSWQTIHEFGRPITTNYSLTPIAFISQNPDDFINPLYADNPALSTDFTNDLFVDNRVPRNVFFYKDYQGIVSNTTQLYFDPEGTKPMSSVPMDANLLCLDPDPIFNKPCLDEAPKNVSEVLVRTDAWRNRAFNYLSVDLPASAYQDPDWNPNSFLSNTINIPSTTQRTLTAAQEQRKINGLAWNERILKEVKINSKGILTFTNLTATAPPPFTRERGTAQFYYKSTPLQTGTILYIDDQATVPVGRTVVGEFDFNNDGVMDYYIINNGSLFVSYSLKLGDTQYYYASTLSSDHTVLYFDSSLSPSSKATPSNGTTDFNNDGVLDNWTINNKGVISWKLLYKTIILNNITYYYIGTLASNNTVLYTDTISKTRAAEMSGLFSFYDQEHLDRFVIDKAGTLSWVSTKHIWLDASTKYYYSGNLESGKTKLYLQDMTTLAPEGSYVTFFDDRYNQWTINSDGTFVYEPINSIKLEEITYYYAGSLKNGKSFLFLNENLTRPAVATNGRHDFTLTGTLNEFTIDDEGKIEWQTYITLTTKDISNLTNSANVLYLPLTGGFVTIGSDELYTYSNNNGGLYAYSYDELAADYDYGVGYLYTSTNKSPNLPQTFSAKIINGEIFIEQTSVSATLKYPVDYYPSVEGGRVNFSHFTSANVYYNPFMVIKPNTGNVGLIYVSTKTDFDYGKFFIKTSIDQELPQLAEIKMTSRNLTINYLDLEAEVQQISTQTTTTYYYKGELISGVTKLYYDKELTNPVILATGANEITKEGSEVLIDSWQIKSGIVSWKIGRSTKLIGGTQYYFGNLETGTTLYQDISFSKTNNGVTADGIASKSTFRVTENGEVSWYSDATYTIKLEGIVYYYIGELLSNITVLYLDPALKYRAQATSGKDYNFSIEDFYSVNGKKAINETKFITYLINNEGIISWYPNGYNSIVLNSTKYYYRKTLKSGTQLYTDPNLKYRAPRTTTGNYFLQWPYFAKITPKNDSSTFITATTHWLIDEEGKLQFAINNQRNSLYDIYVPNILNLASKTYYYNGTLMPEYTTLYTNPNEVVALQVDPNISVTSAAAEAKDYFVDAYGNYNRAVIDWSGRITWGSIYNSFLKSFCYKETEYYYNGNLINGVTSIYKLSGTSWTPAPKAFNLLLDINKDGYPDLVQIDQYGTLRWMSLPLEFRPNPSLKYYFTGELISGKTVLYEDRDLTTVASDIEGVFDASESNSEPLSLNGQSGYPLFYRGSREYLEVDPYLISVGRADYKPTGYNGNTKIGGNYFWISSYYTPGKPNVTTKRFKISDGVLSWSNEITTLNKIVLGVNQVDYYYSASSPLSSGKVKVYAYNSAFDMLVEAPLVPNTKNVVKVNEQPQFNALFHIDKKGRFAYSPGSSTSVEGYYSPTVNVFFVNNRRYYYIGNNIINNFTTLYEDTRMQKLAYDKGKYDFLGDGLKEFKISPGTGIITWNAYFPINNKNYFYSQNGTLTPGRTTIYNFSGEGSNSTFDKKLNSILEETYNYQGVNFLSIVSKGYGTTTLAKDGVVSFVTDEWGRVKWGPSAAFIAASKQVNLNGAIYSMHTNAKFEEGAVLWKDSKLTQLATPVYNATLGNDLFFIPLSVNLYDITENGIIKGDVLPNTLKLDNGVTWYYTGDLNPRSTVIYKDKYLTETLSYNFGENENNYKIEGISGRLTIFNKFNNINLGNINLSYEGELMFNKTILSSTDERQTLDASGLYDFNFDGTEESYTIFGNGTILVNLINTIELNGNIYYYKGPLQSETSIFYQEPTLTTVATPTAARINNVKEKLYTIFKIDEYGVFIGINQMSLGGLEYYYKDKLVNGKTIFYSNSAGTTLATPRQGFGFIESQDIIDAYVINEQSVFSWQKGKMITLNNNQYYYYGELGNGSTILYADKSFVSRAGVTTGIGDFTLWENIL